MPSKSGDEVSKDRGRAENWYRAYGGKITRGFIQVFGRTLTRNEWVVYLALSSYHNLAPKEPFDVIKTGCCWPKVQELQEASGLGLRKIYRALRGLYGYGLVERWALCLKRGRRRRIRFFRMLHVSWEDLRFTDRSLHLKDKQQLNSRELGDTPDDQLPDEYGWRQQAQPIRARELAGEGEVYMYVQDEDGNEELVPRGKRKRKRKEKRKRTSEKHAESKKDGHKKAIGPELRDAMGQMYGYPNE